MIKNNLKNRKFTNAQKIIGKQFISELNSIYELIKSNVDKGLSENKINDVLRRKSIICHTEANPMNLKEYAEYIKNSILSFKEVYPDINIGYSVLGSIVGKPTFMCIDAKLRLLTEAIDKNREISVKDILNITTVYSERWNILLNQRLKYPYANYLEYFYMNNIDKIYESFKDDIIIKYLLNEKEIDINVNKTVYNNGKTGRIIKNRTSIKSFFDSIKDIMVMDNNNYLVSLPEDNVYNDLYTKYVTFQNYSDIIPYDIVKKISIGIGTKLIDTNGKSYILLEDIRNNGYSNNKEIMTDNGVISMNIIDSIQLPFSKSKNISKLYLQPYQYYTFNNYMNLNNKIPKNTIFYDDIGRKHKLLNIYNFNKPNITTNKGTFNSKEITFKYIKHKLLNIYTFNKPNITTNKGTFNSKEITFKNKDNNKEYHYNEKNDRDDYNYEYENDGEYENENKNN